MYSYLLLSYAHCSEGGIYARVPKDRVNNAHYYSFQIFLPFIGREPITWSANNCLQIMVCWCVMSANFVCLQIIFCPCKNETTSFSFLQSLLRENGRSSLPEDIPLKNKLDERMIKQLLNSVIAKYRVFSVSCRSINYLRLRLRQIIDLLATDKSRYFAQLRLIIVNWLSPVDYIS